MTAKSILLSVALGVTGMLSVETHALSPKRGVSENQFQYKAQLEALAPGVDWYYNWGNSAGANIADFESMEFVPMCWNGNYNEAKIREYVAAHPGTKYLLGFNEPNFTNQANMTPQAAAQAWPAVQALARELGLKLVAPALNYSPNPPYQDPLKWMDEFVSLVGNDAFDYLAVHSYGGFNVLKTLATNFHERYNKPVWVTEFCYWPNEGDPNSTVTPDAQVASMIQSLEWLEKTEWIYRYAWFKAVGQSSSSKGPNYGLLLSGKGEEPRELSTQGLVYTYLPDFDTSVWQVPNQYIPALNFVAQNAILMDANQDAAIDTPIEISRFNAGAYVDYQFELTGESATALTLRVGGQGEPVRFDPTIGIYEVDAEGTETGVLAEPRKFELPGEGQSFIDVTIPLNLAPGRHRVRVRDTAPAQPSGILISAVKLQTPSSVSSVEGECSQKVDVYSVAGVCVRRNADACDPLRDLPAGLYIADGKKVLKR